MKEDLKKLNRILPHAEGLTPDGIDWLMAWLRLQLLVKRPELLGKGMQCDAKKPAEIIAGMWDKSVRDLVGCDSCKKIMERPALRVRKPGVIPLDLCTLRRSKKSPND